MDKTDLYLKITFPNGKSSLYRVLEEPDFNPIGYRVLVPLKSGKGATAIVVGRFYAPPSQEILFADSFPDRFPVVNPKAFFVLKKVLLENLTTLGESVFKLIPSWADWYQETFVVPTEKSPIGLPKAVKNLFEELKKKGKVPYEKLVKKYDPKLVNLLREHHLVKVKTEWIAPKVEEVVFKLKVKDPEEVLKRISRASKRRKREALKVLELFEDLDLPTLERFKEEGVSAETLRYLEKKGILERFSVNLPPFKGVPKQLPTPSFGEPLPKRLLFRDLPFEDRLKEVVKVAEKTLSEGKDLLLLVPELELLEIYRERLYPIFGDRLAVYHSALPQKEAIRGWFSAAEPYPKIFLTTPRWLFVPLPELGAVVLEDESSPSYKMFEKPYLNLKKLAFLLAEVSDANLVLFSNPPSLEVHLLSRGFRVEEGRKEVKVLVSESKNPFKEGWIYEILRRERSLVLVPKKGYSNLLCPRCGKLLECPRCESYLILRRSKEVVCPLCGFKKENTLCPECGSETELFGYGVERVKEVLKDLNVEVRTSPPSAGEFPTVAVLFADNLLSVPDYRKGEELFIYLKKAKNLTAEGGILLIHSKNLGHHAFKAVVENNDELFYDEEVAYRKLLELPPFARLYLVAVNLKEENEALAKKLYKELKTRLHRLAEVEFSKAPTFRIGETYRYQILVKLPIKTDEGKLKKALEVLKEVKNRHKFLRVVPNPLSLR